MTQDKSCPNYKELDVRINHVEEDVRGFKEIVNGELKEIRNQQEKTADLLRDYYVVLQENVINITNSNKLYEQSSERMNREMLELKKEMVEMKKEQIQKDKDREEKDKEKEKEHAKFRKVMFVIIGIILIALATGVKLSGVDILKLFLL